MKSFFRIATALIFFHSYSSINATPSGSLKPAAVGKTGPSKIFPFKEYKDFQISDGIAGKSLDKARKIFVEPFQGVDMSQLTQNDLNNLITMARAATDNEKFFNEAMEKAGATKRHPNVPLSAGKTANKILKLVGSMQVIELHKRLNLHPGNPDGRLKELQTKLTNNLKLDHHYAGKKMVSYLSVGQSGGAKQAKPIKGQASQGGK
ncbi:hypothetical protein PGTUg99_032845 [Puccinia graminis f. sp. tritici]|uniref:Uncharacterized protein n=2 Tax=Puccinia graminis f. sp. tritici TaxID=56615 RepID=H6QSL7_PUCGT|nr:uncharacterized protein PGTG_21831 [Puccinia graminis f. sp. tritici CRL 75-36-700-3]EHS63739.1 hypothetical protein PGTG_21831 [Puccinia graminis f. sp. tritici CRL 75-36-700-3]KAA1116024.1 hypothetical protein PGTUg99_032845 [Puccinia graminis f. sp. tritici]